MKKTSLIQLIVAGVCGLFISLTVQAEDCSEVPDLSAPLGPARNQGNIGWCYANATADLLTYRYQDDPRVRGKKVSAIYTAFSYNEKTFQDSMAEGGFMFLASKKAIKEGFCWQSHDDELLSKGLKIPLKDKLKFFRELQKDLKEKGVGEVADRLNKIEQSDSILNRINRSRLIDILTTSSEKEVFKKIADEICQDKYKPTVKSDVKWHVGVPKYNWNLMYNIDKQLQQKNIVGVVYFSSIFRTWSKPHKGPHASVLVGRRKNPETGQCEYLLRNSWGTRCDYYENPDLKKKGACENGNLWVPRERFSEVVYGVTFLPLN